MPKLEKITIQNWRNIKLQELGFSAEMNCVCGNNGEGKTNLLDAIYYLSMTKSAFGPSDKYNFRHSCNEFALAGTYLREDSIRDKYSIKVNSKGEKKLLQNGKAYSKISEHIGKLPIVMVCPSDSALISEGGEDRRRFVSSVMSQMDREHLTELQKYNKLLAQRNSLLKSEKCTDDVLESIDYLMDRCASRIFEDRVKFCEEISPRIKHYYELFSASRESVELEYRSDLHKGSLSELLKASRGKDLMNQFTGSGIQRDDFIFLMNGMPIRKTGSQGQQKCFLLALKFAQYELMKSNYGYPPILLLDDIFDKLDLRRSEKLLEMVCGKEFGQIFLSDTSMDRVLNIIKKFTTESICYKVKNGEFSL